MRILFVSGVSVGGSWMSTNELADALAARGHEVGVLGEAVDRTGRWMLEHRLTNGAVRFAGSPVAGPLRAAAARIGRRPHRATRGSITTWSSVLVQNSLPAVLAEFRPEVVVASSIGRMAWRSTRDQLAALGVPSVLYMREETAIGHLAISDAPPDLLVANSARNEVAAAELGFTAHFVPSVIDLSRARVESTREVVLFINPVEVSGRDVAVGIARACPDLRFAFSESWPLSAEERAWLDTACAGLANIERRARVDDLRVLYGDAKVLLVPYRTNGRPRVILEAGINGIPVLATDLPALTEAVGPGGVAVPVDAGPGEWAQHLRDLLEPARYDALVAAAREHATRDEVDPDVIVGRFEELVRPLVAGARGAA
ncbi:MAG: glycosyltransferase [Actinomycetes bacterium]